MGPEGSLNPRSCAASSMTTSPRTSPRRRSWSQSAFVRGFIDDARPQPPSLLVNRWSQSAFVRGFIDDSTPTVPSSTRSASLNPRSCAASSMTLWARVKSLKLFSLSQSAFVRGFIDDASVA